MGLDLIIKQTTINNNVFIYNINNPFHGRWNHKVGGSNFYKFLNENYFF